MDITKLIQNTIDLHLHIGPEIIPRKFNNVNSLIENQKNKIKGFALKNHFYSTVPFIKEISNICGLKIIGSVTLNNFNGGLNPETVYANALIADNPIIVWFPTVHADNFLKNSQYEIPPEWVQKKGFQARLAQDIKGITVLSDEKTLTQKAVEVLKEIKTTNSILATGHLSWKESKTLIEKAGEIGIKKMIITHPIYQRIDMPIDEQKYMTQLGAFIEIPYSMYSIDKISIKKIVQQIQEIGYQSIILSSDVGQLFSENPNEALKDFAELLIEEGITYEMLWKMMVENPQFITN
jgi:hypothetical protein